MNSTAVKIEALLFYLNEEVKKKYVAELVGISLAELEEAISQIREIRADSGIVIIDTATAVALGTHPEAHELIESLQEQEESTPLSKAALETLSVIAYRSPVTKAQVDTIRGVNSMYSIRNLLVRGLVSRRNQEGSVVYEPTSDTLKLLGISSQDELPDYQEIDTKISQLLSGHEEQTTSAPPEEGGED